MTRLLGPLGCGRTTVGVYTRGGSDAILADVPFTSVTYGAQLGSTSDATVTLDGLTEQCRSVLDQIRPWRHELRIDRDGKTAFVGPVVTKGGSTSRTFAAKDLSIWMARRRIRTDLSYHQVDIATIFAGIVEAALAPDPSPNITLDVELIGVLADREVPILKHLMAQSELDELFRTGADWHVEGRTIVVRRRRDRPANMETGVVPTLLDVDFATLPTVLENGMAQRNDVLVRGFDGAVTSSDADTVFGEAAQLELVRLDGLLDGVFSEDTILDSPSAAAGARARLALVGATPLSIGNAVFADTARVPFEYLRPGALVDLDLTNTALVVSERRRITGISVTASSDVENVSVDTQPAALAAEVAVGDES